jgi:hypothetical protein
VIARIDPGEVGRIWFVEMPTRNSTDSSGSSKATEICDKQSVFTIETGNSHPKIPIDEVDQNTGFLGYRVLEVAVNPPEQYQLNHRIIDPWKKQEAAKLSKQRLIPNIDSEKLRHSWHCQMGY